LRRLIEESRAIGHVPLELRSAELLARALSQAGFLMPAEELLRATLSKAERHEPWARSYQLHWQLANVLRASGRAHEAERQGRAASEEVTRLRLSLPDKMRVSFDALADVMEIDGPPQQLKVAFAGHRNRDPVDTGPPGQ